MLSVVAMLTVERLREVLDYDPETGIFTWRRRQNVGQPSWNTKFAGKVVGSTFLPKGYRVLTIENKKQLAHRIAWAHFYGEWPAKQIDHINLDKADNRIANLRAATHSENQWNRGANEKNGCGFKGVKRQSNWNSWMARITVHRKVIYLGCFPTAEAAAAAYSAAALQYHGQFARDTR